MMRGGNPTLQNQDNGQFCLLGLLDRDGKQSLFYQLTAAAELTFLSNFRKSTSGALFLTAVSSI